MEIQLLDETGKLLKVVHSPSVPHVGELVDISEQDLYEVIELRWEFSNESRAIVRMCKFHKIERQRKYRQAAKNIMKVRGKS